MSCPLPRIGDSRTVRQVVDAHAAHGTRYRPLELGSSWNTLGKLVRQQSEKHVLRGAPAMLQPLAEHTEQTFMNVNTFMNSRSFQLMVIHS